MGDHSLSLALKFSRIQSFQRNYVMDSSAESLTLSMPFDTNYNTSNP